MDSLKETWLPRAPLWPVPRERRKGAGPRLAPGAEGRAPLGFLARGVHPASPEVASRFRAPTWPHGCLLAGTTVLPRGCEQRGVRTREDCESATARAASRAKRSGRGVLLPQDPA
ncbi:ADP-ribosylation factor-like protein 4A isoform X2 [Lutra lutra]|uniref:ADP-ribosylation factor-like protein 4A isoform X2 n=1 Tax=Lutra lutra TaxID=9657 RepID=UPI001FD1C3E5|nr:ADP-ribosylation factor-like protein 4A isoform X2 [Lutra lutra]XP_047550853.1 ADP-ribosylation factor-like protein 4A isoform X2 [Lutra lutra]